MLNSLVNRFCTHIQKLTMSHLTGDVAPDIDIYDDVAVLTYELPSPLDIEQVMDYMEDDMGIRFLYRAVKVTGQGQIQHVCEVEHPAGRLMYKVNAIADLHDLVSEITVTIFTSLEQMCNDIVADQNIHVENGFEIRESMDDGEFVSMFAL